ncbi:MAG: hypothetical protein ABIQ02_15570 [Saprospiraceae bacterium]
MASRKREGMPDDEMPDAGLKHYSNYLRIIAKGLKRLFQGISIHYILKDGIETKLNTYCLRYLAAHLQASIHPRLVIHFTL